ncbi:MAG: DNA repair protein RecN [Flavobacteriales bacterium]
MLRQLHISNYALIEHVELHFEKGMTAITGETGSGKSILLGAFGMLLGERADSKAIQDEKAKCIIEAIFDLKGYGLKPFFAENDLDYEQLTTIRREISLGGKSRAFVNDTPVQLNTLKALGAVLVDIHSQHENSLIGERQFQFSTVDSFAGNQDLISNYQDAFKLFKKESKELDELTQNEARIRQELDYMRFQLNELEKANLEELNQKMLEEELETLNNAEHIKGALNSIMRLLDGEENGVLTQISAMKSAMQKLGHFHTSLDEFGKRADSTFIELKELLREIESFELTLSLDEKRIFELNEKLSALYALQQKHRLKSIEELIQLREELQKKCGGYDNLDEMIAGKKTQLEKQKAELEKQTIAITKTRRTAAAKAETEVKSYFTALSLEHAELKIDIRETTEFNAFGRDEIQFLFKANKGGQLLPVKQVASGGEISRVMLALKAAISHHKKLPVLILDEIDQGVSGEVGKKIGIVLKEMSAQMQLLTITHLPQIAGKAEHHFKVFKDSSRNITKTHVESLGEEQRINELAEMLSGKSYSKAALENARELRSK